MSKLYGRSGIITFESNGLFVLTRGAGVPRLVFPGFRDIRGYQAMYRDFHDAITDGRAPEMSLERAVDDQRLMDDVYSSLQRDGVMGNARYDVIIIGSGAGGGTMAHALPAALRGFSSSSAAISFRRKPRTGTPKRSGSTFAIRRRSAGSTNSGHEFRPYTHYNVGGNTKFWGSVLYRLRREDFQPLEHMEGISPGWPIDYDTLAPYYERAERLYQVHGELGTDPTEPERGDFPYAADSALRSDG